MAKGVGLRLLSRRGSWVQIPPSAPDFVVDGFSFVVVLYKNMTVITYDISYKFRL